jgi:hypothetical protein
MNGWSCVRVTMSFLWALALGGCPGPDGTPDSGTVEPDAGPRDGGSTRDGGGALDAGMSDAGPVEDGNDSIATAEAMSEANGIFGAEGELAPPGSDLDFFSFQAAVSGAWQIAVAANPEGEPNVIDPVMTLFDSDGTALATNDNRFPASEGSRDPELLTMLPEPGTYYVSVQDRCSIDPGACSEDHLAGIVDTTFALSVAPIDPATPGIASEGAEPNDTINSATSTDYAPSGAGEYRTMIGYGEWTPGDVDGFALDIPADVSAEAGARAHARVAFPPSGSAGNGGSARLGVITVFDVGAFDAVVARLDYGAASDLESERPELLVPVVPGRSYVLTLEEGPAAIGGTAPFYFFLHDLVSGGRLETAETANAMIGDAETLSSADGSHRIDGDLPQGDLDHLTTSTAGAELLDVVCEGASAGSGVTLRATVFGDDRLTVLGSATETAGARIELPAVDVSGEASVVLRVEPVVHDTENSGYWYRCALDLRSTP